MRAIIGTKNKRKISIAADVFAKYFPEINVNLEGMDIDSGVPDTPRGEESKLGAFNRATSAANLPQVDCGIGLESGLVKRYGLWFEEAWACVILNDTPYYGYSSGLPIPKYVLDTMAGHNLEHGAAMRKIRGELDQFDDRDTWGTYSGKLILRDISLAEALRNALVQTIPSKDSLYHL